MGPGDFAARRCKYRFIYSHDKTGASEFCVMILQTCTTALIGKRQADIPDFGCDCGRTTGAFYRMMGGLEI